MALPLAGAIGGGLRGLAGMGVAAVGGILGAGAAATVNETISNKTGAGGTITDAYRKGSKTVVYETSATQANDGLFDFISASSNKVTSFFSGGLATFLDIAGTLLKSQTLLGWAKDLRGLEQRGQDVIDERTNASRENISDAPGQNSLSSIPAAGLTIGGGILSGWAAHKLFGKGAAGPIGPSGPTGGGSGGVKAAQQAALDNPSALNKALSETMDGDGNTIKRVAADAVEETAEAVAKKPGLMSRILGSVTGRYGKIIAATATVATIAPSVLSAEEAPAEAPDASGQTPTVREAEAQMLAERSLSEKIGGAVRAAGEGLNHGANSALSTVAGTPHWLGEKMGIDMPEAINGNNVSSYFNELTDRVAPAAMIQNAVEGYKKGGFSGAFENVVDPAIGAKSEAEKKIYAGAEIAGQLAASALVAGPVGSFGAAALGGGRVAAAAAPIAADIVIPTAFTSQLN